MHGGTPDCDETRVNWPRYLRTGNISICYRHCAKRISMKSSAEAAKASSSIVKKKSWALQKKQRCQQTNHGKRRAQRRPRAKTGNRPLARLYRRTMGKAETSKTETRVVGSYEASNIKEQKTSRSAIYKPLSVIGNHSNFLFLSFKFYVTHKILFISVRTTELRPDFWCHQSFFPRSIILQTALSVSPSRNPEAKRVLKARRTQYRYLLVRSGIWRPK